MSTCDREELREVSAAVLAVTSHLSVREVLQTIVTAARRLLDTQYAALGIPDENGSFTEFLADGLTGAQWRAIGPVPRQHGILGLMLRDPNPVRMADIRTHPDFGGWPRAHPDMVDFLGMPVIDGEALMTADAPASMSDSAERRSRSVWSITAISPGRSRCTRLLVRRSMTRCRPGIRKP